MAREIGSRLGWSDVTPKAAYLSRRQFAAAFGAAALVPGLAQAKEAESLEPNTFEEITSYNNFYEFGTGKDDPKRYAGQMTTDP